MYLTNWIISMVDWPQLFGSWIRESPPNLFSQYVNFCLRSCCQNSNQSTMKKTCFSELRLIPLSRQHIKWAGGLAQPFPPQQAHYSFSKTFKKRNNIFSLILLLLSPSINGYQTSIFSSSQLRYCLINVTSQGWEAQAALGAADQTG